MSEPAPLRPTRPGAAEADASDLPVTPEVERIGAVHRGVELDGGVEEIAARLQKT